MARKPMVTRTLKSTEVNVLCLDIENGEPCNHVVTIAGTFNDDKLMKEVEKIVNTGVLKAVHVVSKKEVEKLYGMSEEAFMANAIELDAETRKPLEVTEETEEVTEETEEVTEETEEATEETEEVQKKPQKKLQKNK